MGYKDTFFARKSPSHLALFHSVWALGQLHPGDLGSRVFGFRKRLRCKYQALESLLAQSTDSLYTTLRDPGLSNGPGNLLIMGTVEL